MFHLARNAQVLEEPLVGAPKLTPHHLDGGNGGDDGDDGDDGGGGGDDDGYDGDDDGEKKK